MTPDIVKPFLQIGRVVFIEIPKHDKQSNLEQMPTGTLESQLNALEKFHDANSQMWGWGIIVGYGKIFQPNKFYVDVLIPFQLMLKLVQMKQQFDNDKIDLLKPISYDILRHHKLDIQYSFVGFTIENQNQKDYEFVYNNLLSIPYQIPPVLDYIKDLCKSNTNKIANNDENTQQNEIKKKVTKILERVKVLDAQMEDTAFYKNRQSKKQISSAEWQDIESQYYAPFHLYIVDCKKLSIYQNQAKMYQSGEFTEDLKNKLRLLKRLGFLQENILTAKGTLSTYVENSDELLITELIFSGLYTIKIGMLNELNSIEIACVLGLMTNVRLSNDNDRKAMDTSNQSAIFEKLGNSQSMERIHKCYEFVCQKITELVDCKREVGIKDRRELDVEEQLTNLKVELVPVIYKWMNKEPFVQLCKMTNAFEGEMVRALKHLNDLLLQLTEGMQAIGNADLKQKFMDAQKLIHHGIVFAPSLYVEEVEDTSDKNPSNTAFNNQNIQKNEQNQSITNNQTIRDDSEVDNEHEAKAVHEMKF
ncbi:hypothetical protein RFI_09218 [Reticulomyxa filosa]|uniref:ATP-dependent RNA helicase Ski2/MTR4 C-terminal domain-containing protein n=1 Tax=Reticulomyxa filosa TaxID=46433 RepID=X6NPJ6_RETFI|nr:hypothetical protein RFI_09218 [Reticulomyxa filosa]|eukprot:ETO27911.1 hypothetical protein RFI_09218 [Reticulomyxa filosa]